MSARSMARAWRRKPSSSGEGSRRIALPPQSGSSRWKTCDRSVILLCGGESAAEADTAAAVWTPTDEEAARFGGSSMPTYEFECRDCQNRFEVIALITEHAK